MRQAKAKLDGEAKQKHFCIHDQVNFGRVAVRSAKRVDTLTRQFVQAIARNRYSQISEEAPPPQAPVNSNQQERLKRTIKMETRKAETSQAEET